MRRSSRPAGTALRDPMICSGCGFDAPADFAFCPKCGARLATPPPASAPSLPDGDRRPVTVLFADLVGFTTLSEGLDPEDVRAIQSDLFREMSSSIERYEGFVEKFVGDAVMAVFGAPKAHEDDPERGLRAALLMHERMDALNRRWERRVGRPLALHIGVNTGPVVAGRIGAAADAAYAVTGDTVNTASRLQSAAPAGEILVSDATYQLTQHAFAFAPPEAVPLKGKSEPAVVHRLRGPLAAPRSARGLDSLGLAAPLVGRERELRLMQATFDATCAGRAQVLSLVGEPGAGKSRLQRDFLARLDEAGRLEGVTVRRAAGSAMGEQTYGVVAGLLRDAYGVAPGDSAGVARSKLAVGLEALGIEPEDREAMAAALAQVLGLERDDARMRHLPPEQLKRQIFMATRTLVERRLAAGPLVLIVEDLHWADAASVELLGALADRLADRPLLILLVSRSALAPDALGTSRAPHSTLEVAPLSRADGEGLLAAWFGDSVRLFPEPLRTLILERAGGNPLYLEEVVRALIAAGVLVRDGDAWRSAPEAATAQVPSTLQGLLLARLDRLDAAERRVLQEAAVIGPRFDAALLRAVSGEPARVDAALDALVRADLVVPGPDHRFRHGLLQETVYQNILVAGRTELHTRVGTALESQGAAGPESLERLEALGHHWALGADKARGARYLMAAGDWARGMYANADAIRHYQRALGALEHCDAVETEQLVARERMADLLGPIGRRAAALGEYEIVEAGYRAAGDAPAHARILRKMGGLHWDAGARARALQCFEAGLGLLADDREHIEQAHLYQEMGRLAFRSGDSQRAVEWAEAGAAPRRAARRRPRARRGRTRGSGGRRRAEPQHARRRFGPPGPDGGGGRAHRAQRDPRPRGRALAGRLSRARQPERALQHARSGPGDRDLRGRPRDGQEDRRPGLPVAPLCESRGGLLRAHQPLRRAGHRRGARRHRSRSAPRAARSPGGAAHRARADLPVSRRSDSRDRPLSGSARARRGSGRAAAALPLL